MFSKPRPCFLSYIKVPRKYVCSTLPFSISPSYGDSLFLKFKASFVTWENQPRILRLVKYLTMKLAFGFQSIKSPSNPTLNCPLISPSPAWAADLVLVQSMICPIDIPLFRPSVHIRLSPSPSVLIPPHALIKSPLSKLFNSATQGLWSDTTQLIVPSWSASHSRSLLNESRMGGQHLNSGRPDGIICAARHK